MTNKPATVSQTFPSQWLHADDLNGRTYTLTIDTADVEQFPSNPANPNSEKTWKPVISFMEAQKRLIMNKTQATAVAEICQSETFADWPGHRITLHPATARNKKPTIRITPAPAPKPKPSAPVTYTAEPPAPDEPTFDPVYDDGTAVLPADVPHFWTYCRANNENPPINAADLYDWIITNGIAEEEE